MTDSTIKKVSEDTAPKAAMGQTYLVSGKRLAMRLWRNEQPQEKESDRRDYETVEYVLSGRAELHLGGTNYPTGARRFLVGTRTGRTSLQDHRTFYDD